MGTKLLANLYLLSTAIAGRHYQTLKVIHDRLTKWRAEVGNYTVPALIKAGMPLVMNMLAEAASKRTTLTYGEIKHAIETKVGGKFSGIATEHIGHVAGSHA